MVTIVPFNASWLDNGSLDLLAVYRRPRTHPITREPLLEAGRAVWDYVNLPMKRHNDWMKKGYEYVTLARVKDLQDAKALTAERLASYKPVGEPEERSFLIGQYLVTAAAVEDQQIDALRQLVDQFGSAAVEQIKRTEIPGFTLPVGLRGILPPAERPKQDTSSTPPADTSDAAPEAPAAPKRTRAPKPVGVSA